MSNRIALNILAVVSLVLGSVLLYAALPTQPLFNSFLLIAACFIVGSSIGLLFSDKSDC